MSMVVVVVVRYGGEFEKGGRLSHMKIGLIINGKYGLPVKIEGLRCKASLFFGLFPFYPICIPLALNCY